MEMHAISDGIQVYGKWGRIVQLIRTIGLFEVILNSADRVGGRERGKHAKTRLNMFSKYGIEALTSLLKEILKWQW